MKIQMHHVVAQAADCVTAEVGTDLVVSHLTSGCYVGLNQTARAIWNLIAEPASPEAICGTLLTRYKVDEDICKAEVLQTLDTLQQQGLVSVVETSNA